MFPEHGPVYVTCPLATALTLWAHPDACSDVEAVIIDTAVQFDGSPGTNSYCDQYVETFHVPPFLYSSYCCFVISKTL